MYEEIDSYSLFTFIWVSIIFQLYIELLWPHETSQLPNFIMKSIEIFFILITFLDT